MKMSFLGAVTASALAVFGALAGAAAAQDYPNRPVKVIVPFAAGGGTDVYTRIWAENMSTITGQRFLVENMPGAAGAIGTKAGIASDPDGYTIIAGVASTIAINPHTLGDIGYEPLTEMKPVGLLAYTPWIMVGSAKLPFDTVEGLMEYDKANPGQLTFASWTSTGETGRKVFALRTGIEILPVPYDGAVAAMNDLVAGRASVAMLDLSTALPFIRSGDIRALAVTGPEPTALIEGVPAIAAAGVTNMNVNSWVGLFAPAGVPDDIIAKLNAETGKIVMMPEVKARFAELGGDVFAWSPAEMAEFVARESATWKAVIAETSGK